MLLGSVKQHEMVMEAQRVALFVLVRRVVIWTPKESACELLLEVVY